jgi:predicted RNA methylase
MCATRATDWRKDFGLDNREPPYFFVNKDQLTRSSPQAYAIRRAFDLLDLDGVLCTENSPLVYFKQAPVITPEDVRILHKKFWNHGSAPILVLITKDEIQVYSGMAQPAEKQDARDDPPRLVQSLDRVSQGLREFLISVETGSFFQRYARLFNPDHRVDRSLLRNLEDTRNLLIEITRSGLESSVLDALLCRLVFTCYLFDRGVILPKYLDELGLHGMTHLRDVLALKPVTNARAMLYKLFAQLEKDFNGDLFRDDLDVEARQITNRHIQALSDFFQGTLVRSGQQTFWPYDFSAIPIETISAIYEHFLKTEDKKAGAFYTPRVLAEIALDTALERFDSLLDKRFLDPACGSGIFLVGLFNRMAEEWRQVNPKAQNDRRARELMRLLQEKLFGADINPTACRITAFSLYLAYLDQLTPRDIQELQSKGRALPRLIAPLRDGAPAAPSSNNIRCTNFFAKDADLPISVDLVVGNPPWGSLATKNTAASKWCAENRKLLPDMQIAAAFVWKATEHISAEGHICFVLPHGLLFNHGTTAVAFQKAWLSQHTIRVRHQRL